MIRSLQNGVRYFACSAPSFVPSLLVVICIRSRRSCSSWQSHSWAVTCRMRGSSIDYVDLLLRWSSAVSAASAAASAAVWRGVPSRRAQLCRQRLDMQAWGVPDRPFDPFAHSSQCPLTRQQYVTFQGSAVAPDDTTLWANNTQIAPPLLYLFKKSFIRRHKKNLLGIQ